MPNTYSNVALHLVFAVKHRQALVHPKFREELQKYISGIFRKHSQKVLAIYCMPDHAHILFSYRPSIAISELVMQVKVASTTWIKDKGWISKPFHWQNGYGIFSCDPKRLDGIVHYIMNQENHHRAKKFIDEYREILKDLEIEFDEKYIFEDISNDGSVEERYFL